MGKIILDDGRELDLVITSIEGILSAISARVDALEQGGNGEEPPPDDGNGNGEEPPPDDGNGNGEEPPPPIESEGVWLSEEQIASIDTSSAGWQNVLSYANKSFEAPDLSTQKPGPNANAFAAALVFARTGDNSYREKAIQYIDAAIPTAGGRTLEMARNLPAYIVAADLVGYDISGWLSGIMGQEFDGMTLMEMFKKRPNNWGTSASTAIVAAALYLNDAAMFAEAVSVFKGWLGDRSAYSGFDYGDLSWQADPGNPVGVNPAGATKEGHSIDGVLPDDQRRTGGFTWPAPKGNYPWGALQGAGDTAWMLHNHGQDVFAWSDSALMRAVRWLTDVNDNPAEGDDTAVPILIDKIYGTEFARSDTADPGKSGLGITHSLL